MALLSHWLKALAPRIGPKHPRRAVIEPVEPRLHLAGDLVSEPTGVATIGAAAYSLNSAPDDRFTNVPVAIFADSFTKSGPADFTATIDWGDGTADSSGRIIRNANDGTFYVLGTHRYATQGQFNTAVSISHTDGRSTTAAGVAFISEATSNVTTDFSAADNPSGVWTYGWSPEGFVPYGDQLNESGLVGWGVSNEGDNAPNILHNPTTADVTLNGVTYAPDQLALTPGSFGESSILLFTAPTTGVYHFTALFRGLDDASANVEIFAAGNEYLNSVVSGSGTSSTQFMAAPVSLNAGDMISFRVGYGFDQSNAGDTVALDVRVTEISQLPTLFGSGAALSAKAGNAIQDEIVATFFDSTGQSNQTDFTATIRWGDGTRSDGNVTSTGTDGMFQVIGTHTYKDQGTYDVTVILRHADGRRAEAVGVAVIEGGRTFTARGINVVAIEGLRTAGVRVATFTDSRKDPDAGDYAAQISWGDDSVSAGQIVDRGGGRFVVRGRHTYRFAGSYPVSVTILDQKENVLAETGSTGSVVDAPRVALTERVRFTTGENADGDVLFSFIDVNPFAGASTYAATIDWGDGSSAGGGTIQSAGGGRFDVLAGGHAYASAGKYTIRIRLFENDQRTGTYRIRAIVRDPATSPNT